jgi:hypothetical protein
VGHIGLPFSEDGQITALGLKLPLPADTTFVASLRFQASVKDKGALHVRIDEIAASEQEAARSAQALAQLLALLKAIQSAQQPAGQTEESRAMNTLVNSVKIEQRRDRATLTANLPAEALHRLSGQ